MTRSPSPNADPRLETALQQVLDALPTASPPQRAFLLKRAGDLCVSMEQRGKALGWYGRAVDQTLELGDAEGAAQICRLIIFVQPEAVRARCTLTWIALGTGDHAAAVESLGDYADAARRTGQKAIAVRQLGLMFDAAADRGFRERLVFEMTTLDDVERVAALAERLRAPAPPPPEREQLWARVLDATIGAAALAARTPG
jgi:hypothetical protein